jgi:hypothetical protein
MYPYSFTKSILYNFLENLIDLKYIKKEQHCDSSSLNMIMLTCGSRISKAITFGINILVWKHIEYSEVKNKNVTGKYWD